MPKLRVAKKKAAVQEEPQDDPDPPVTRPSRKSLRVAASSLDPTPDTVPTPSTAPRVGRQKKSAVPQQPVPEPPTPTSSTPRVGRPKKTAVPEPPVPETPDPVPTTSSAPRVGRAKKPAPPQPPVPEPPTPAENVTLNNVSPRTAHKISTTSLVVRLKKHGQRTRTLPEQEPQDPPPQQHEQPQNPPPRRKKRVRREPQPPPNDTIDDDPPPPRDRHNILLPSPDSFPAQGDNNMVVITKLRELRDSIRNIFCLVMDQIQEDEDNRQPCYESVEKVYEYFDRVVGREWGEDERVSFGGKYRNVCVHALYQFGAVVWKQNCTPGKGITSNPFATAVAQFLEYCFIHLGWKAERGRAGMSEWKDEKYAPAAYYVVRMFNKFHCDKDPLTRQHQLSLINKLLESSHKSSNPTFIQFVWETIGKVIMIRVKDKTPACRVLSLKILSFFVGIEDAYAVCQKELKYYTRCDPFVEVRRLGTKILAEKTSMKMRFFFDQAFDKDESVRAEAFRAFSVEEVEEEGGGLVREMNTMSSERLCKAIVWGAMHSGPKIREIVKNEILPKWMKITCKSDLVKFLLNIDAYQHMKAVVRILDMLLTTEEQQQFVESLDLSFVEKLKRTLVEKRFTELSIETFVAWLGLCKASKDVASIREKVVPSSEELLGFIGVLHEAMFLEHEEAKMVGRNEDITPVFCLVIALEVGRGFVLWEEGGRRELVKSLKEMLLDPLLDERVVVIQAINTLHSFADEVEFEDIMMNVLQDLFDARLRLNRSGGGGERRSEEMVVEEVVEEVEPERPPLTAFQLAKLKERVCDLAMKRVNLQKEKDELLRRKMFIDAAPVSNEIGQLQTEEASLKENLRNEEEYAREWRANAERREREREERERVHVDASEDDEMEEDESRGGVNRTGVISSVEEGLSKAMFMINAYLDLCPKMSGFVRGLYDAHIPVFLTDNDVNIRMSVVQFMTRIAMIEKGEMRKIFCFLVGMIIGDAEVEVKNIAFQCVVDLVVCYEFSDFCLSGGEGEEGDSVHTFLLSMTHHLKAVIPYLCTDYCECTPEIMEKFLMELLTVKFPPITEQMNDTEICILNTTKNVGLLKLVVRGRLRDPVILARILCLWANQDYAGTPVLRDLEHVLKLYETFEWWGGGGGDVVEEIEGEVEEGGVRGGVMMRVLGVAVAEGAIMLCGESCGGGRDVEEVIGKFVGYFVSFLVREDQPLMRTIVTTILTPVCTHPTRSYNSLLVKCATKIPITSRVSATAIIKLIHEAFIRINEHPATSSIRVLRRELLGYLAKLKRLFGDDIAVVTDSHGRAVTVGRVINDDDDDIYDDDFVEEEDGDVCSFGSERGGSGVENEN